MIKNTSIEALKAQIDIVDIIANSLELKKAGVNLKANCPFHDEKSGSFVVSPVKQICHCFGCGIGFDAIGFVQEYKKLTFIEAVEDIANYLNFTLQYDNNVNKKDYSKIMEFCNDYYMQDINNSISGYLKQRGITEQSIKNFEIGFAPSSTQQINTLKQEQFNINEAIECGVLALDEKQQTYARLTNRISFPIRNHTGKLIGFGGRILPNDKRPGKYINSPDTVLFNKSRNLYGYNLAKEHIHKKGTFVVVEGYLDVVMFHQAGIQTAVATMGTALTELHCNIIKKVNAKVLLCFDGDKAGQAAAFKASKLLSAHEVHGGVVIFPEGKDPADMVADGKVDELKELMQNKTPLIEFTIKYIANNYSLNVPQQKQEALKEIALFLQTLSPLIQDEYKDYVAQVLNINKVHIQVDQTPIVQQFIPMSHINIGEMNIINSANENEVNASVVLKWLKVEMFDYHQAEFNMLLHKDKRLQGILLLDGLSIYNEAELTTQVKKMLIKHYEKSLFALSNENMDYERKSFELKKIKGIIYSLKKEIKE